MKFIVFEKSRVNPTILSTNKNNVIVAVCTASASHSLKVCRLVLKADLLCILSPTFLHSWDAKHPLNICGWSGRVYFCYSFTIYVTGAFDALTYLQITKSCGENFFNLPVSVNRHIHAVLLKHAYIAGSVHSVACQWSLL